MVMDASLSAGTVRVEAALGKVIEAAAGGASTLNGNLSFAPAAELIKSMLEASVKSFLRMIAFLASPIRAGNMRCGFDRTTEDGLRLSCLFSAGTILTWCEMKCNPLRRLRGLSNLFLLSNTVARYLAAKK